jgi:hypothetical protein
MNEKKVLTQLEMMNKLRKFWKRNPRTTPRMVQIWDKYWIPLSRFNKELLCKEFGLGQYEKEFLRGYEGKGPKS